MTYVSRKLFSEDITRAMKIVHGTAVASGIKVEGYEEWLATAASQLRSVTGATAQMV